MSEAFAVDLDRLDQVLVELARSERALAALGDDLEARMRALHGQWTGLAASAQAAAHAEWTRGLRAMHAALGELGAAGAVAHDNYARAAETNRALWRAVQ